MNITIDEIDEVINAVHNQKRGSEITDLLLDIRLKLGDRQIYASVSDDTLTITERAN